MRPILLTLLSTMPLTSSDKGNRWVERIVSLRQTCRLQGKSSFHVLVEAMDAFFKDQPPDLEWIRTAT